MDQVTINATLKARLRVIHVRAAANGLRMHTKLHGGLNRAARRQLAKKHRTAAEGYGADLRRYITSVNLGKIRAKQIAAYQKAL